MFTVTFKNANNNSDFDNKSYQPNASAKLRKTPVRQCTARQLRNPLSLGRPYADKAIDRHQDHRHKL
jgi:hypothetical protein